MFSPSSISRGEALSSDNRKQVLREGEALGGDGGGGEEDGRIEVTSVPYGGDWRGGSGPKKCSCAEPDCLKWKFLRRKRGALHR